METSIAQDGTRVDKVRLSDRIRRLELIGRHVGVKAFVERAEVTGKDGRPIEAVMVFNPVGSDEFLDTARHFSQDQAVDLKDGVSPTSGKCFLRRTP